MITSESRIEDLDKILTKHQLILTAVATGNLWTVSVDSRSDLGHYVGSGGTLFEALSRALCKFEKKIGDGFSAETVFSGASRGRK